MTSKTCVLHHYMETFLFQQCLVSLADTNTDGQTELTLIIVWSFDKLGGQDA